jgi:hypothetical protein
MNTNNSPLPLYLSTKEAPAITIQQPLLRMGGYQIHIAIPGLTTSRKTPVHATKKGYLVAAASVKCHRNRSFEYLA